MGGADLGGLCVPYTAKNYLNDVLLKFGSGAVLSCSSPPITDVNAFKAYCEKDLGTLKII